MTKKSEFLLDPPVEDPLKTFDKKSTTNLTGGYVTNADPEPLYRVPDLLTAKEMSDYLLANYGVIVQIIPPGYEATLVEKLEGPNE